MFSAIKKQPPARIISMGFALVILLGSLFLMLPCCINEGVELHYIDSLYTSTSAVCVTGLVTVDAADTFTPIGRTVIALLIQIGGLGVTAVGAGIILAMGKKIDLKSGNLVREAMNLDQGRGISNFVKDIFITTIIIEFTGAALSLIIFAQDFPFWDAVGISVFHSIAAFNNAGFDILGNFQSLSKYENNVFLNSITALLIFLGGIGFLAIKEFILKKGKWKKFSMHLKVVLSVSAFLIVIGAVLLKLTEDISWLSAFFNSVSARTAGFSTTSISTFSKAGLIILMVLMYIGASPGSTGGGIKTSTFFVIFQGIKSAATNKSEKAFHYSIPKDAYRKASVIAFLSTAVIIFSSFLMSVFEPDLALSDILFEMTSAFGTVGLSTGITPMISTGSKIVTIFVMFIGRLGPLTIASLWYFGHGDRIGYAEGNIAVG